MQGLHRSDVPLSGTWSAGVARACPENRDGYPWRNVGTAFDYELRFCLGGQALRDLVAYSGAQELTAWWGLGGGLPQGFIELTDCVNALERADQNWGRPTTPEGKRKVAQVSLALALYEQCYRAQIDDTWPLLQLGKGATLEQIFELFRDDVLNDLVQLSNVFIETQPELLAAKDLVLNPKFDASPLLGGADADLIVDGRLLDIKTTIDPKITPAHLWQVLGYALADFSDCYGITEVGLYFSRQGIQVAWDIGTLMELMSGAPHDLNTMRQRFREILEMSPDGQQALAWASSTPSDVLARLARDEDSTVRRGAAGNPSAPPS